MAQHSLLAWGELDKSVPLKRQLSQPGQDKGAHKRLELQPRAQSSVASSMAAEGGNKADDDDDDDGDDSCYGDDAFEHLDDESMGLEQVTIGRG